MSPSRPNGCTAGCRSVADPGQRNEEEQRLPAREPAISALRALTCASARGDERKRSYDQAETKLPDSTELRLKQNGPPRCRRESILERQSTHARNFQPKPEQSRKKRCDRDSKQPRRNSGVQSRRKSPLPTRRAGAEHNEIEGEDSREQNRRADMHCASDDELCREHRILLRTSA